MANLGLTDPQDWAAEFETIKAAWADTIVPLPPFAVGQKIVERRAPQHGSLTVTECAQTHGYWRVGALSYGCWTSGPADAYVRAPRDGWVEPPSAPLSGVDYLGLPSTVAPPSRDTQIRHALAMAAWWRNVGSLIAPDLAEERAAEADSAARVLIEEARE